MKFHPAFAGPALFTIEQRPPGDDDERNTLQTIRRMIEYIRADSGHPSVVRQAANATRGTDPRPDVHRWIRAHVQYADDVELAKEISADPNSAEVLVRPVDLLAMPEPRGDCDDQSMLCAAMLQALGVRTWLKTIAADPDSDRYSHVYVMADGPAGPMALDCSHGAYAGWEARATGKTKLWPVEESRNMNGLGFTDSTDTNWWQGLITTGMDISGDIFKTRYGVPQLAPGQTVQSKSGFATQLPYGTTQAFTSGANTGMLMLIVAGVVVVILATRK